MQWAISHLIGIVGVASIVSAVAAWIVKSGSSVIAKEIELLDDELLADIKDPVAKQFVIDLEAAVNKAVPDAGDARYAALTDIIMKEVPLNVAPYIRPILIASLTALGSGAKQGLSENQKP